MTIRLDVEDETHDSITIRADEPVYIELHKIPSTGRLYAGVWPGFHPDFNGEPAGSYNGSDPNNCSWQSERPLHEKRPFMATRREVLEAARMSSACFDKLGGCGHCEKVDRLLTGYCNLLLEDEECDTVVDKQVCDPTVKRGDLYYSTLLAAKRMDEALAAAEAKVKMLIAALRSIKNEGAVCENYELCRHVSCLSSYAAWAIADNALHRVGKLA